jgi:hypothetical protein
MRAWIGVDLDGTLAEYHGWNDGKIGPPVPKMVERVKGWIAEGKEVRVVTARVAPSSLEANGQTWSEVALPIQDWCRQHIRAPTILSITHEKDFGMVELWDDRAVQVIPNTGERVDGKG